MDRTRCAVVGEKGPARAGAPALTQASVSFILGWVMSIVCKLHVFGRGPGDAAGDAVL